MKRHTIRAALATGLASASGLTTVQVSLGHPGDQVEGESIWFESSEGTLEYQVWAGTPPVADDKFTIPIQIQAAAANQSMDEAEARAAALYDAVETYLQSDTSPSVARDAVVTEVNGPATGRLSTGCVSFIRAVLTVEA